MLIWHFGKKKYDKIVSKSCNCLFHYYIWEKRGKNLKIAKICIRFLSRTTKKLHTSEKKGILKKKKWRNSHGFACVLIVWNDHIFHRMRIAHQFPLFVHFRCCPRLKKKKFVLIPELTLITFHVSMHTCFDFFFLSERNKNWKTFVNLYYIRLSFILGRRECIDFNIKLANPEKGEKIMNEFNFRPNLEYL